LLSFTKNFMNEHILRVAAIGNTMSLFKNIENGVPQGAMLSVTLFLVYDKIQEPTKILGYMQTIGCYIRADGHPEWLNKTAEIGE
jgi:hypothetical protein